MKRKQIERLIDKMGNYTEEARSINLQLSDMIKDEMKKDYLGLNWYFHDIKKIETYSYENSGFEHAEYAMVELRASWEFHSDLINYDVGFYQHSKITIGNTLPSVEIYYSPHKKTIHIHGSLERILLFIEQSNICVSGFSTMLQSLKKYQNESSKKLSLAQEKYDNTEKIVAKIKDIRKKQSIL